MDFLILILAYVLGFLFCVFIYFFGDHPFLKHGVIGAVRKAVWQVLKHVVPLKLTEDLLCKVHILLNSRNQFFRITFGTMVVLGHTEFIIDVLPMLYKYLPEENHVVLPIISVFLNLFLYNKCCNDDPGEITARSLHKYKHVYPYDNKMFVPGVKCKTCQLEKPARSKHCSICDRCVHRFDHHCIWTNSDVGGMTHGSFVLFLLSLTFILSNGVYVICRCLILHSEHYKLLQATVMTPDGDMKSITLLILFQHLFMNFPRMVFMLVSLTLLIPMVATFTLYHLFLICFNQTTNERYKKQSIQEQDRHHSQNNKKRTKKSAKIVDTYNRGVLKNLYEVFCVKNFLMNKSKER